MTALVAEACQEQEGWKADLAVASIFITLIVAVLVATIVLSRRR